MSTKVQDAIEGERWEFRTTAGKVLYGKTVCVNGTVCMASSGDDNFFDICPVGLCSHGGWTKTHNADGSPYEEPKPLPEFGECWAARDRDGDVFAYRNHPVADNCAWWDTGDRICLGKIAFRPDLPWDQTACRVRVRLEVVEDGE